MTAPQDTHLVIETVTDVALAAEIAEVAALTFPLACPPHSTPENIAAHIRQHLSAERFVDYMTDPHRQILTARSSGDGQIIGYALLVHEPPTIGDVRVAVTAMPGGAEAIARDAVTEVSKMYVLPDHHAARNELRPSHALMRAAVAEAAARGSSLIWLGVHSGNERAKRYYAKMGFRQIGTKSFDMNGAIEHDFVLARQLHP